MILRVLDRYVTDQDGPPFLTECEPGVYRKLQPGPE